jgi:hypothetical protein
VDEECSVIRLFVGADGSGCDLESQAVLEYSVRKYASEEVSISWMQQAASGPWSGWQMGSARTPFTHFRWGVPAACDFTGKAIYCDSDFIFRADIAELWRQDVPGVLLVRNPEGKVRTCCMVFDCKRARGHIPTFDDLRSSPDAQAMVLNYLKANRHLMSSFDGDWNSIDLRGYADINDPAIKGIHYSRIETQVHLKHALPRLAAEGRSHWYQGPVHPHPRPELQALFDQELAAADAAGYTVDRYRIPEFAGATRKDFRYRHQKGGR